MFLVFQFILCLALLTTSTVFADATHVRIGVLSFRSLEHTRQQWQSLASYLENNIAGHQFEIVPLYYPDLDREAAANNLAFIMTNPEHYVILRQHNGFSAIATLMPIAEGHPVNQFGGVIIARADREDIQKIDDLAGKTIASPDPESFGGFIMQRWELYKYGIEAKDYIFTGMPHDKAVDLVVQGVVDAGFIRSGIIEALMKEGKLSPNTLTVIHQQTDSSFPQAVSTSLYPEWPFAASASTDIALIKAVSLALLNLDNHHPVALDAHIFGFSSPADYSKVEAVMLNMNIHPDKLKNINLLDIYYRYRQSIWGVAILLAIIVSLGIKLLRMHHRLRQAYLKYHLVADYTSDWEYWRAPGGEMVYMSPSCQSITGYDHQAFKSDPLLLDRLVHPDDLVAFRYHRQFDNPHQESGELEFRIFDQNQRVHWIHHLCRPVFDAKGRYQGVRASNRDITHRKQIETELRLHDAGLKSCGEAIVITDVNTVVQWVNPAFCELTGYSEDEILNRSLETLVGGEHIGKAREQALKTGSIWREECISHRKNGEVYQEQLSITPVCANNANIVSHFVLIKQDISERKRNEEQIRQLAFYDPLTQLPNRRLLIDRLEQALASCQRHQLYGALLFIDLDRFKLLNDSYGHDVGDQLLQEVGKRLKISIRQQDTVARLGGDEFVVLLVGLDQDFELAKQQAEQVALKLHRALGEPYSLALSYQNNQTEPLEYQLTASIGINLFLDADNNADNILKQADIAMYNAKHQGRNAVCLFISEQFPYGIQKGTCLDIP